jgi:hypothetical protein
MPLSFPVYWLLSSGGTLGVNWNAGTELASNKGVWHGGGSGCSIEITKIGSVYWKCTSGSEANLGRGGNPDCNGPDVYIWFKNKANGKIIGGFLDRWTLDRDRFRTFGNIKKLWHMNPALIIATASEAQLGLCGQNGGVKSSWYRLG